MILTFNIYGIPKAKQSTKFKTFRAGDKTFTKTYQPKDIVQEADNLRTQFISQLPVGFLAFTDTVKVLELCFTFPPLKGFSKTKLAQLNAGEITLMKTTKPDLDNLEKMVYDAMEGVVFINDSLIAEKRRIWKKFGNNPGIHVILDGCWKN